MQDSTLIQFDKFDNKIVIPDSAIRNSYTSKGSYGTTELKTNLLGLDSNSSGKFELKPIKTHLNLNPSLDQIIQNESENCAFIAELRTIVRRDPTIISKIISEFDETHVEVKLFTKEKEEYKQISYILEKTIIKPAPSIFNRLFTQTFFASSKPEISQDSIKLLEKALVLHFMQGNYPYQLINLQVNELNTKVPSYGHVVTLVGQLGIYSALLGCETEIVKSSTEQLQKMTNLEKNFSDGELITVMFYPNKFGLESEHSYELVNYARNKTTKEEFAIVSNPWGYNYTSSATPNINISSLTLSNELSNAAMVKDNSLLVIPIDKFKKLVCGFICTKGAKSSLYLNNHNLSANIDVSQAVTKRINLANSSS